MRRILAALLAALAVLLALPLTARATTTAPAPMQEFTDRELPGLLREHGVPGAVVSAVQNGRTVLSRGYGYADQARRTPFDPETSMVRIASITKLITWTAVMQQVEQGRIDLHADVNRYLDFRIPATFDRPITMLDLMDHTAGFEERVIGEGARTKDDVPPLGEFLASHMPARVRPPGQVSAYSNYGAALAGHIVARVSGQPYEQYVEQHVLAPLGMRHSTATEPVPAALRANQAVGYDDEGAAQPFVFDRLVPDGSITASAADMTRFGADALGRSAVLGPEAQRLMQSPSFRIDPRLGGWAHGFQDRWLNGHRVLMHDGSWQGFQSVLLIVPDQRLTLFVSANSTDGIEAVSTFLDRFSDRFLPAVTPPAATDARAVTPVAGFYAPTRRSFTTIEKVLTLGGSSRLKVQGDRLTFQGKTWVPAGPGLWRDTEGRRRLTFTSRGGHRYVATDRTTLERLPAQETALLNGAVLLGFAATLISALVGLPLAALVRRLRGRPRRGSRWWRTARILAVVSGVVGVLFVAGIVLVLAGDTGSYLYGVPVSLRVLLVLPLVAVALAGAAAVLTVLAWRSGAGVLARLHQLLVLAGSAGLVWFLAEWNLLGWQF
jgi:CubicO group peptidase (beta-lactamase class C family)